MSKTPPPPAKKPSAHPPAPAPGHPAPGAAAPPAPKQPAAPTVLKEDGDGTPTNAIWIQPPYGDVLIKGLAFTPTAPLIHIDGVEYRHVSDHPDDGTWVYRSAR